VYYSWSKSTQFQYFTPALHALAFRLLLEVGSPLDLENTTPILIKVVRPIIE
jgi:hypothetical protein